MKNRWILILTVVLLAACVLFSSCRKDEVGDGEETTDTESVAESVADESESESETPAPTADSTPSEDDAEDETIQWGDVGKVKR